MATRRIAVLDEDMMLVGEVEKDASECTPDDIDKGDLPTNASYRYIDGAFSPFKRAWRFEREGKTMAQAKREYEAAAEADQAKEAQAEAEDRPRQDAMLAGMRRGWYWIRWYESDSWAPAVYIEDDRRFLLDDYELKAREVFAVGPRLEPPKEDKRDSPFKQPDDDVPTLEVDMEFPSGTARPGLRMTDAELIAALRRKPYDRAAREAADRLEGLTRKSR